MIQDNNFEPSENFSDIPKSKKLLQMARIKTSDPRLRGIAKERLVVSQVRRYLNDYPMVIIAGPRKVGKTTALLQIAVENGSALYIDCRVEGAVDLLSDITLENKDMLLLLDEFHHIPRVGDWMHMFNTYGEQNKNFRVVLTGSVSAFATRMAQIKGGGRNRLIHLPLLTYLEYLHFTGDIPYDADLTQVTSETSFKDYMVLKNLKDFKIPTIDLEYASDAAEEIAEAKRECMYPISSLNAVEGDIRRALLILAYKLIDIYDYDTLFGSLPVANRELDSGVAHNLRQRGYLDKFSVWNAVCEKMTVDQISDALTYLLWGEYLLCNYDVDDLDARLDVHTLSNMRLGRPSTKDELKSLFSDSTQLSVINPLFYSVIADELWMLLEDFVANKSSPRGMVATVRKRLGQRETFLDNNHLLGNWVEAYLRGAFALRRGRAPLVTTSFVDALDREIDIVQGDIEPVLIEVAVRNSEKNAKDVNFHLAYTGKEKCFLTTKQTLENVHWNSVPIWRIPYHMLAAFLDRGEIPAESVLRNVTLKAN